MRRADGTSLPAGRRRWGGPKERSMVNGAKAGLLLAFALGWPFALGCSTRGLVVQWGAPSGAGGSTGGVGGRLGFTSCFPGPDGGFEPPPKPVAFDGRMITGAPQLMAQRPNAVGVAARALALVDLDADSRPDLVAAKDGETGGGTVSVAWNLGGGAFSLPTA